MQRDERVDTIEALRGLAALAVAWFHFTHGSPLLTAGWLKSSGAMGWLGVEAFFVISGFVIPWSMARSGYVLRDAPLFLAKRLIRVQPPYLAALALTIFLLYASSMAPGFQGPPPQVDARQVLLHVVYLSGLMGEPWLSPVFWTLAIEIQYYLLISLIFPLLAMRQPPVAWLAVLGLCLLSWIVPQDGLVIRYLGLFSLGILAFQRRTGLIDRAYLPALLLVSASVGLTLGWDVALVGLASALAISHLRLPQLPVLAYLGSISYSLYLVHVPIGGRVLNLATRFCDTPLEKGLALVLALAASIAAAHLLSRIVEKPAQAWASRLRYRPRLTVSA